MLQRAGQEGDLGLQLLLQLQERERKELVPSQLLIKNEGG